LVSFRDNGKASPLHFAARFAPCLIRAFFAAGCDIECTDERGETPLMVAARNSYTTGCAAAEMLLDIGANPCVRDETGSTPLHMIARYHAPLFDRMAKKHPEGIEMWDFCGNTPLYYRMMDHS
jgi:ankyrin repeat protein